MEVKFVPACPEAIEAYFAHRQDPGTKLYNPVVPSTLEEIKERISKSSTDLSHWPTAEAFFWMIEKDGQVIGNVSLQSLNKTMLTAEMGYGIFPSFRGLGFAAPSLRAFVEKIFHESPLRKIYGHVHKENKGSIKSLEKAGFIQEGILREHFIVNGQPTDEIVYGILKRDL